MNTSGANLVILGSGSTAFAAALAAQEMGLTAIMTEERVVGGTCVNRGCLPSKHLIEAAKLIHDARDPRYRGITPAELKFSFEELIAQKDEVIHVYREKKYESLVGGQVRIEQGHARFTDPHTVQVDGKQLSADRVLIATGSRPVLPDIEGLDRVPYMTSDLLTHDEAMELTQLPRSILIIGGGYISLELGQMFLRFGSSVTVVERNPHVLAHGYEPEVGPAIGEILCKEGMQILSRSRVQSVRSEGDEIVAEVAGSSGGQQVRAEKLLIATGRRPNTDRIGIEKAGVLLGAHGEIQVNEHLRTSVEHIFAAGDAVGRQTGSQMATPVGSQDGGIAAHNAFSDGELRVVNHRVIPRVIFTDPQIAVVGMTEEEAVAAGHRCWCNTLPMSLVPRAGAILDTRGLIKMVADAETDEVLGVSIVGHSAGEVIHEAAMAMRFRATLRDFVDMLHVYPTMAEALKIVAISRWKNPAKLSCCAE